MKSIFALLCVSMSICAQAQLTDTTLLQPVELISVRAAETNPVAKTNLSRAEISKYNIGQDLPFILNTTPSVIVNSDAGNGIGYTGIRIRGTDATRVNVTLNGIPYNDAESQGTFFVDLPDIASSAGSIQVQRGVGTSSNGAGAFGGTINISTNDIMQKRNIEFNNSFGSYHSFKNTLIFNSGIFAKNFTIDARLSNIRSDGYIDRAFSRLQSWYTSAAYVNKKSSLRLNVFSGKEKTYQAWNGVDANTLKTNRTFNSAGTEKSDEPYANETDNYTQTHYQAFYNRRLSNHWKTGAAIFLTKGKGYYEQYKASQELGAYGLPDFIEDTAIITETDLIRRLWLDNNFYGAIFSLQHQNSDRNIIIGANWNKYDGKHFGEIISAVVQKAVPVNYRWYDLNAHKTDLSGYVKWTESVSKRWQTYIDLQVRSVGYDINGFRNNPSLKQANDYVFFNPKAGITYSYKNMKAYLSFAHATKEPNRDDFEAAVTQLPKPEHLNDIEFGIESRFGKNKLGMNLYYMFYKDQLVLSGKINDVGAYSRTNIPESYRAGIELQAARKFNTWLAVDGNLTLSTNKVKGFTEYIDDYDNGGQQTKFYQNPDLPFSPASIANLSVNIIPFSNTELTLTGKSVGRQYLDNTSQKSRSLDPYYVQDVRLSYTFSPKKTDVLFYIQANNVFSEKYEANGYTFSYYYNNELTTENYYFPMAPLNFMFGINFKIN